MKAIDEWKDKIVHKSGVWSPNYFMEMLDEFEAVIREEALFELLDKVKEALFKKDQQN
jgi:hypothetical protein